MLEHKMDFAAVDIALLTQPPILARRMGFTAHDGVLTTTAHSPSVSRSGKKGAVVCSSLKHIF